MTDEYHDRDCKEEMKLFVCDSGTPEMSPFILPY